MGRKQKETMGYGVYSISVSVEGPSTVRCITIGKIAAEGIIKEIRTKYKKEGNETIQLRLGSHTIDAEQAKICRLFGCG